MGLITTGPPPFDVYTDERIRVIGVSPDQRSDFSGEYGYVSRTPSVRDGEQRLTLGVQFDSYSSKKSIILEGAQIEWLDRVVTDVANVASTSHKGEHVFYTQTAATKAGTVGQVTYNNRIIFETGPQQDQKDDQGRVVKTAAQVANDLALAKIDEVVDGLFA